MSDWASFLSGIAFGASSLSLVLRFCMRKPRGVTVTVIEEPSDDPGL